MHCNREPLGEGVLFWRTRFWWVWMESICGPSAKENQNNTWAFYSQVYSLCILKVYLNFFQVHYKTRVNVWRKSIGNRVSTRSEGSSYQESTVHMFTVKISFFDRFVLIVSTHWNVILGWSGRNRAGPVCNEKPSVEISNGSPSLVKIATDPRRVMHNTKRLSLVQAISAIHQDLKIETDM